MPFPVVVDIVSLNVLEITARCFFRGQLSENVYWYQVEEMSTAEDYVTAMAKWQADAQLVYAPLLTNGAIFLDATLRIYSPGLTPLTPTLFTSPTLLPGTGGGTPMPTQVAGLITRRVLRLGNSNRGRVYVPFPDKTASTLLESPSPAYRTALALLASTLMSANNPYVSMGGNSWDAGIGSVKGGRFTPLIDTAVQGKWATQRRRGDYGTPNVNPVGGS